MADRPKKAAPPNPEPTQPTLTLGGDPYTDPKAAAEVHGLGLAGAVYGGVVDHRLKALCDDGSLHVIRSEVSSRRMGDRARAGDGVIGAAGRVNGRPVFAYAQDT